MTADHYPKTDKSLFYRMIGDFRSPNGKIGLAKNAFQEPPKWEVGNRAGKNK